jgi:YfiH family protein
MGNPSLDTSRVSLHAVEQFNGVPLSAAYSERYGGVSEPPYEELNLGFHVGDEPDRVRTNRERLAARLGVPLEAFVVPRQIHRGNVHRATSADRGRGAFSHDDAIPDTDALITDVPGLVLAVMLADCVPVIVFDPEAPAVGVAHAGWGGTLHHITRLTVEAMQREFGSEPSALVAGIGPAIGPDSYEVGDDVADRAREEFPGVEALRGRGDKWLFDLWTSNMHDLTSAGVPADRIELAAIDTFENTDRFFSDRRVRPTGRFMAVATLRG